MSWHFLDIRHPGSQALCVLQGNHGATFVLKRSGSGQYSLQRLRGEGIEVFAVNLTGLPGNPVHVTGCIDKDNEMAFLVRAETSLVLMQITQAGNVAWRKELVTAGSFSSAAIAIDAGTIFVGLGVQGTVAIGNSTFTDDGVAAAFTRNAGQHVWSEKLLLGIGAIAVDGHRATFCGVSSADAITVQSISYEGQRQEACTYSMSASNLQSAIYTGSKLHLAGVTYVDDGQPLVYQIALQHSRFSEPCLTKIDTDQSLVELHASSNVVYMYVNTDQYGSWLLLDGNPYYSFTDNFVHASPQIALSERHGSPAMGFLKCGSLVGEFNINHKCFDIGEQADSVAYVLYIEAVNLLATC